MTSSIRETIIHSLGDSDPNVILCGIKLAGLYGIKEAEDKIISFLSNKAWQVREASCTALGLIGSGKAKPHLIKLLGDKKNNLRQEILACAALSQMSTGQEAKEQGSSAKPGQMEGEVWQVKKAAAIALSRIDPELAENLLKDMLKSSNSQVIIAAMSGLTTIESSKAGEHIMPFLDNQDINVKKAAVICLGKSGVKEAADGLIKLLEDQKPEIRKETLIALNHIKVKKTIPYLVERMKDSDVDVRTVAAVALGNTGSEEQEVIGPLQAALDDKAWEVREAAVNALSNLGVVESVDKICSLLSDSQEKVRRAAALALMLLIRIKEKRRYM